VAPLLAVFELGSLLVLGGRSWAEEKEKAKEEQPPKEEVGDRVAKDLSTAYDLVDYARRKKDPKAMCVAVEMLIGTDEPEGGEEIKIKEGAKEEKPKNKVDQLHELLDETKKWATATEASNKKLIEATENKIEDKPKGTPNGGTTKTINVLPFDSKKPATVAKLTRLFVKNGKCIVWTTSVKPTSATGIDVKILDPSGALVAHDAGTKTRMEWIAPHKETVYTIEIRNYHNFAVSVRVDTN
jgi:hypothetical protein